MRSVALASAVLLASCAAPRPIASTPEPPLVVGRSSADAGAPDPGGVRFGHPPAVPGAKWRVSLRAESHADGAASQVSQVSTYLSDYRVEVLAVDGPAPSRLRVHVDRNVNAYQDTAVPTAVDGKDYVVDVREPHVRDAAGTAAVPAVEADRVLAWFPDLGTRARLDEILPDESMRIGEARDDLVVAILRVLHPTAWKLDEGHATLARADGANAEFDVSITTTSVAGMTMTVAGTARVRLADAFLVDLDVRGNYQMGPDTGRFEVKRAVTSEAAASSAR